MILLLICIYILAFALEVAGGWIVAADIIKDKHDIKKVLEEREHASQYGAVEFQGGSIGGAFGAMLAQNTARQSVMDEFTLARLRNGYRRRWWGISLVVFGALVGTVGNIISTFP